MASITSDNATVLTSQRDAAALPLSSLMKALGSLKLTVGLFSVSLVLVLVGTLAQDEMNMLDVKNHYFLSWITWLKSDDFFPQAFLRHDEPIPGRIPFPGGALVGMLLMVNLVAAKVTVTRTGRHYFESFLLASERGGRATMLARSYTARTSATASS